MPAPYTTTADDLQRKGAWKVTVTTLSGKRYHYNTDTERDADLFIIAINAHGRDIAEAVAEPV